MQGQKNYTYQNWSKTYSCHPELFFEPSTTQEIRDIIALARQNGKKVRIIGKGASPSDICCTSDYMVSLHKYDLVLDINVGARLVKAQSGITLDKLNSILDSHGLAVPNLSAMGDFSLGGIISVGVHGSGRKHGILGSYVTELELMTADGSILVCNERENGELFKACIVGLGVLGVVLSVTFKCDDSFHLRQETSSLSFEEGLLELEGAREGDFGKFLYYPDSDRLVKIGIWKTSSVTVMQPPMPLIWTLLRASRLLELLFFVSACFKIFVPLINKLHHYLLFRKPTVAVDKSYKILHFDCLFAQHVQEWAMPLEKLVPFLRELRLQIIHNGLAVFAPIEVRFARADEFYLSPCYKQDSAFVNAVMFRPFGQDPSDKEMYFSLFERLAISVGGRPHWAKPHNGTPELYSKIYPRFPDFLRIRKSLDPDELFVNEYVKRHLFCTS